MTVRIEHEPKRKRRDPRVWSRATLITHSRCHFFPSSTEHTVCNSWSENIKMSTEPGSFSSNGSMIVVSNRLPFVLKRNEVTGQLERKARLVVCQRSFSSSHFTLLPSFFLCLCTSLVTPHLLFRFPTIYLSCTRERASPLHDRYTRGCMLLAVVATRPDRGWSVILPHRYLTFPRSLWSFIVVSYFHAFLRFFSFYFAFVILRFIMDIELLMW